MLTLCPIALTVGCPSCPVVKLCPAKTLIGNYRPPTDSATSPTEDNSET